MTTDPNDPNYRLAQLATLEIDFSGSDRSLFNSVNSVTSNIGLARRNSLNSLQSADSSIVASIATPDPSPSPQPTKATLKRSSYPPPPGHPDSNTPYTGNPSSFSDYDDSVASSQASKSQEKLSREASFLPASIAEDDEEEEEEEESVEPPQRQVSHSSFSVEAAAYGEDDDDDDDEEEVIPLHQQSRNVSFGTASRVSFGHATNLRTNSLQKGQLPLDLSDNSSRIADITKNDSVYSVRLAQAQERERNHNDANAAMDSHHAVATAIVAANDDDYNESDNTFTYRSQPNSKAPNKKPTGVLKNSNPGPLNQASSNSKKNLKKDRSNRLTKISAMYDLDGSGTLDPIEQAMRDRDLDNDGTLDNAEIYRIVEEQLKSERDVHLYKKVAAGLLCLVTILALSNFGTSWASAILARDTVTDAESGTIQSKASGEVMGLQSVTYEYELSPLTDAEFDERRRLVDEEMMEDDEHQDHHHRKLGKKKKNHCTCSKVAYDHGKIKERDLLEITKRCDGVNQVSIKRTWRADVMEPYSERSTDVDTICGPGTQVIKKGKKKKNKKKTKVKVVQERIVFKKKGRKKDGSDDREISFDCDGGNCFSSGKTLLQGLGHPCDLSREIDGAGECDEDLICHSSKGNKRGSGVCTRLIKYAKRSQVCDLDFGLDACGDVGYACYDSNGRFGGKVKVGVVRTGVCTMIVQRGRDGNVCDSKYADRACDNGYVCLSSNGSELDRDGIGYCTRLVVKQGRSGVCDLSYGQDACGVGYYCHDSMLARNGGRNGNGGGNGVGASAYTGAVIAGPSGTIVAGNGGNANAGGGMRARTSGTGMCTPVTRRGDTCYNDYSCGWGRSCVGIGADTATGGTIVGSSGSITWGTGGSTSGFCG